MKKIISVLLAFLLCAAALLPACAAANNDGAGGTISVSVQQKAGGVADFFAKIKAVFNRIINWFKNLFSSIKKIDLHPDAAPKDYETAVETGGNIERTYIAHGEYDVSYFESATDAAWTKYEVYYPTALAESDAVFPVIVCANGSGVRASRYAVVLQHYASWGFIVVGNEHDTSWAGDSSDASLAYILEQNDNPSSVLYHKVDVENVGIVGHSQGGAGVFTAITEQPRKEIYKAAVALSPSSERLAASINWNYDVTKVTIPVFMLAGTEGWFETQSVIPIEDMNDMFGRLNSKKIMARRTGAEHGQMLYTADGYVTAWFMWQLQGDRNAAQAFLGDSPEIMNNPLYQDQRIDLE